MLPVIIYALAATASRSQIPVLSNAIYDYRTFQTLIEVKFTSDRSVLFHHHWVGSHTMGGICSDAKIDGMKRRNSNLEQKQT